jgi:hypothetical protein
VAVDVYRLRAMIISAVQHKADFRLDGSAREDAEAPHDAAVAKAAFRSAARTKTVAATALGRANQINFMAYHRSNAAMYITCSVTCAAEAK